MNGKHILNNGFGSPGYVARAMTQEFLGYRKRKKLDDQAILEKILVKRSWIYRLMGKNILKKPVRDRILEYSNGQLPFIILSDVFVTNRSRGDQYVLALWQNLPLVVEVVLENYNNLTGYEEQVSSPSILEDKFRQFIQTELDRY